MLEVYEEVKEKLRYDLIDSTFTRVNVVLAVKS